MKTLQALKRLQQETKAEVYYVGGFVRDLLRNKRNDDYDIVVRKLPIEEIISFLKEHGVIKIINMQGVGEAADIQIILFRGLKDTNIAQISLPRRGLKQIPYETNSLRQDSKYRDFKINAMYLPIDYKSKKDIIDLVNGRADVQARQITCITNADDCFKISPVRMLRAISLSGRTNYRIDDSILNKMKDYADRLESVPVEVLRKELDKILLSDKPSRLFKLMSRRGLLKYVLPELEACVGVTQDTKYHKYDVFTHCIKTCDHTDIDIVMRLTGLLHDVGKAGTRKVIKGKITFHKHEMLSVKLARQFMDRLRYDGRTKEKVLWLIRMHMYHYTRDYTDPAVRRFIKRANITKENINDLSNHPIFKIRAAERLGNGFKTEAVTQRQLDFEDRIRKVFARGGGLQIKDLDIDGHIIMKAFGLKPSTKVGDILQHLLNKIQEDSTKNNRTDLIGMVVDYLKDQK